MEMGLSLCIASWFLMLTAMGESLAITETIRITRHNSGDIFVSSQERENRCSEETCVGMSSGTATAIARNNFCTCRCHPHLPAFREDLKICVDDIHASTCMIGTRIITSCFTDGVCVRGLRVFWGYQEKEDSQYVPVLQGPERTRVKNHAGTRKSLTEISYVFFKNPSGTGSRESVKPFLLPLLTGLMSNDEAHYLRRER